MKKETTIKKTFSITKTELEKARKISFKIFGQENVSGLFRYWINQAKIDKKR